MISPTAPNILEIFIAASPFNYSIVVLL